MEAPQNTSLVHDDSHPFCPEQPRAQQGSEGEEICPHGKLHLHSCFSLCPRPGFLHFINSDRLFNFFFSPFQKLLDLIKR